MFDILPNKSSNLFQIFDDQSVKPPTTNNSNDVLSHAFPPVSYSRGAKISLVRCYAMVVEIVLVIPLGISRVPKGISGSLNDRNGVGPEYPVKKYGKTEEIRTSATIGGAQISSEVRIVGSPLSPSHPEK